MKKVCAWCGKKMGTVSSDKKTSKLITHSICYKCANIQLAEFGTPLQKFLDGIDAPVALVDSDGNIRTANTKVRKLVRKDLSKIEGYSGGEVFECAYSRLPGGCGNTIHCSGCTIRKTVMETYATGKSLLKVPATLIQQISTEKNEIRLLISTEKAADFVLLRIDEVKMGDSV